MRIMKTRSNVIVALVLIALVSSLAFAQGGAQTGPGQQTTKGAVIKGKAPVNKEVLKVKLPHAEEWIAGHPASGAQGSDLQHAARGVEWWTCRQAGLSRTRELHRIVVA